MKRTLGDAQARPDYLIAGGSVAFGLFCLGGWYSTHQKLTTVSEELEKTKKSLRLKVVGERLIANSRAQELYESLLKEKRNGVKLPPSFEAAANKLKQVGAIHEPVDEETQAIYSELRRRGVFKQNPDAADAAQELIKRGVIHDASGGSVYPKSKTGVIRVKDDQTGKIYEVEYSGKRPTNEEAVAIVEKRVYGDRKGKYN